MSLFLESSIAITTWSNHGANQPLPSSDSPALDKDPNVEESLSHGIAIIFCPSELRRRGYATRHMNELAQVLQAWQSEYDKSIGSILHFVLPPSEMDKPAIERLVGESGLEALCSRDEATIREVMAAPSAARK
ncbi:hypothetical protein MHUMG1_09823 [Metarhizium humberi]|uniref:N-acetyltransferase domain-containing protein n=1 Tax=Metarhizium humberi TaxID=2596975 RepID=A0A9P8M2S8_9HYPO|nr:hypothetical protein MHUMG1_09823 [Metarhizium humberi]